MGLNSVQLLAAKKNRQHHHHTSLTTAVVGPSKNEVLPNKPIISDHKLMITPLQNSNEAHFVCAVLNSSICRFLVDAYCIGTAISTHILEFIRVPRFDNKNSVHIKLSNCSERAHKAKQSGDHKRLADIENEIDSLAAGLWGISSSELHQIRINLGKTQIPHDD